MLFQCPYEANGYCYMFNCPSKATEHGCSGSRNSCLNLKFLYDYSTMEIKDIQRRERAAAEAAEKARKTGKTNKRTDHAAQAQIDQLESEKIALQNKLRQQELKNKREEAKLRGERIDQDVKYAKTRNRLICFVIGFFLLFSFSSAGHSILGIGKYKGDFTAMIRAILLSLPFYLMTFGVRSIGKETLFGKTFRGSAFVRSYLATLLPCLVGLIAVWVIISRVFKIEMKAGAVFASIIIYLLICLLGWALNHTSTKKIWSKGLGYYITQGKK